VDRFDSGIIYYPTVLEKWEMSKVSSTESQPQKTGLKPVGEKFIDTMGRRR